MRTALVAIKPADQVILKGYLRILLRLEADLEWVSANHPDVDLFFINHEVKNADNVVKLLSKQAEKPVLYVKHSKSGEGWLNGNELSLPLKKMEVLNQWLYTHVALLKASPNAKSNINRSIANTNSTSNQDNKNTNGNNNHSNHQSTTNAQPEPTQQSQEQASNLAQIAEDCQPIIDFIKQIHQPQTNKQQILISGNVIATADTKRQILWQNNVSTKHFAGKLPSIGLVSADSEPTGQPIDLKQWLWDNAWADIDSITPLINDLATFQLRYWVKPSVGVERRDLLRIMTAMEHDKSRITDIADTAGTSPILTKKVLAALLFAGYLDKSAYENLAVTAPVSTKTNTANQTVDTTNASPLDTILSQRAAGIPPRPQPASTISSVSQATTNTKKEETPEQKEKLGFFARFRKKLGL